MRRLYIATMMLAVFAVIARAQGVYIFQKGNHTYYPIEELDSIVFHGQNESSDPNNPPVVGPDDPEDPDDDDRWVDLGLPSGTKWAKWNIGATKPEEYGDYYAWGETEKKDYYGFDNALCHDLSIVEMQALGIIDDQNHLTSQYDVAQAKWGKNWRIPTREESLELRDNTTYECTTLNGVNVLKLTSNINGAVLYFPACGHYQGYDYVNEGGFGGFRTSEPTGDNCRAYELAFGWWWGTFYAGEQYRAFGLTTRAVRGTASTTQQSADGELIDPDSPRPACTYAILHHGNQHFIYYGYTALAKAVDAAVDQDWIELSKGSHGSTNIDKSIEVKGVGWKRFGDNESSVIAGDMTVGSSRQTTLKFEGVNHDGNMYYGKDVTASIVNSRFYAIMPNDEYGNAGFDFVDSKVQNLVELKNTSTATGFNTFFYNPCTYDNSKISLNHCVLFNLSNILTNSRFVNTIFDCCNTVALDPTNTIDYCLSIGGNSTACFDNMDTSTSETLIGHGIFKTFGPWGFSEEEDYQMNEEDAAKYIGNDGLTIGINWGLYSKPDWPGNPDNPDNPQEPDQPEDPQEPENDHECVDLGLPSGNLWAAYNVGASKPEEAGSYYSWAETSEKDTYLPKTCFIYDMSCSELQQRGIIDENLNLTAEYDAATVNWGKQWHTPTRTDFDELFAYTTSYWGRVNGVNGRWFESLSNHNKIFMPAVGEIYEVYLNFYNERGYYWSATKYSADEYYKNWVDDIYFQNDCVNCYSTNRSAYFGHVVRPIRRP